MIVVAESAANSSSPKMVTADCPGSRKAVGGGVELAAPADSPVKISLSDPAGQLGGAPTGWIAGAVEGSAYAGDWSVAAYAVCVRVAP